MNFVFPLNLESILASFHYNPYEKKGKILHWNAFFTHRAKKKFVYTPIVPSMSSVTFWLTWHPYSIEWQCNTLIIIPSWLCAYKWAEFCDHCSSCMAITCFWERHFCFCLAYVHRHTVCVEHSTCGNKKKLIITRYTVKYREKIVSGYITWF